MIFITERVGFARTKHPPGASPSAMPDGHALVEAQCPSCRKYHLHVFIPRANQISNLPKLIAEGRRRLIRETQRRRDCQKATPRHVPIKGERWRVVLLVLRIRRRLHWRRSPKILRRFQVATHQ